MGIIGHTRDRTTKDRFHSKRFLSNKGTECGPTLFLIHIFAQSQPITTTMSQTSRRIIGTFEPCKDGVICSLEESLLASQNPLRDQTTFPPRSIQVTVGQRTGHSWSRSFSGERLMKFDAFFTPTGSNETFKADMYLQSNLKGSFNGYFKWPG